MFSPIPFLHGDARRSHSRSPPPSPLALSALGAGGSTTTSPHSGAEGADQKVIGLVDELDDPSPGHLSDHPQPLSATTTVADPIYKSLEDRFTTAKEEGGNEGGVLQAEGGETAGNIGGDSMAVDEEGTDDKENKAA